MRVVVIGGGVIGAASAWRLTLRGIGVTLLEQFDPGHVHGASHGSSRIFRHAFDTSVLHHPDAGRLHADRAVASLLARAQENGADILHGKPVREIKLLPNGVEVATDGRVHRADAVVLAAGAWTPELASGLPDIALPELRTTQEQPAHFAPLDTSSAWPSFVHHPGGALDEADHAGGIYGLSSEHGIKVGEHATGPEVTPSTRSFVPDPAGEERLQTYASRWLPGVDPASSASVTCLYTCSPDHNFVVDRCGRVTIAAGFSGHGFKFAPAVGEYVADLLSGVSTVPVSGLSTLFGLGGRVR